MVKVNFSMIESLANFCTSTKFATDNRFSLHLCFGSLAELCEGHLSSIQGRPFKRERQRARRLVRADIQDLISSVGSQVCEVETSHEFFLFDRDGHTRVPFDRVLIARNRDSQLPFRWRVVDNHSPFQALSHLSVPLSKLSDQQAGFRLPDTLRHFHLTNDHHVFFTRPARISLSLFPDTMECLHYVEDRSYLSQKEQQKLDQESEDFFSRCVHLRKVKIYGLSSIHWAQRRLLFDHPTLQRCHFYDKNDQEFKQGSSPPIQISDAGSRLRRLSLPASVMQYADVITPSLFPNLKILCVGTPSKFPLWYGNSISWATLPQFTWTHDQLQTLVLPDHFSGSLVSLTALINLRRLRLGGSFNHPIEPDHWPPQLQCLVICSFGGYRDPFFPRDDLSDLTQHFHYHFRSQLQYRFSFLPPTLSILLVGVSDHSRYTDAKIHIVCDPRYPSCRICSYHDVLERENPLS